VHGKGILNTYIFVVEMSNLYFLFFSYYCPSGSKYVKPPGFQCWVGHYCPGGDPEPIPCRNNSYVNYTGAVQCEPCPAGFYCVIAGTTVKCPEGESKDNNLLWQEADGIICIPLLNSYKYYRKGYDKSYDK
jgi:hypothetical protein